MKRQAKRLQIRKVLVWPARNGTLTEDQLYGNPADALNKTSAIYPALALCPLWGHLIEELIASDFFHADKLLPVPEEMQKPPRSLAVK